MVQEGEQQRRVEIGQSDGAGRSTECCRRVVEEQAQGIPVCRYGLSADRTLLAEMIQKEALDERRQCRGSKLSHELPPRKRSLQSGCLRWPSNPGRSEEHTSELKSLMRNPNAVFCWNKKNK